MTVRVERDMEEGLTLSDWAGCHPGLLRTLPMDAVVIESDDMIESAVLHLRYHPSESVAVGLYIDLLRCEMDHAWSKTFWKLRKRMRGVEERRIERVIDELISARGREWRCPLTEFGEGTARGCKYLELLILSESLDSEYRTREYIGGAATGGEECLPLLRCLNGSPDTHPLCHVGIITDLRAYLEGVTDDGIAMLFKLCRREDLDNATEEIITSLIDEAEARLPASDP